MERDSDIRWSAGSELTVRVGTVAVHLRRQRLEDIIRSGVFDAVVSSDDAMLSMSGGVAGAIRELAGNLHDEVADQLPLPVGTIAITSGGRLSITHVIHAVTVDIQRGIRPTSRTVHRLIREILSRGEGLNIRRLVLPALATGTAGLDPETSSAIIARALREHVLNPTILEEVTLPVPDLSVWQAFARALSRPLLEEITAIPPMIVSAEAAPRSQDASPQLPQPGSAWTTRLKARMRGRMSGAEGSEVTVPALRSDRLVEAGIYDTASRPVLNRRYVLLEELGRGGMGIVYLSWDLVLQRSVAVKVVRRDKAEAASLKREAAAAFELTHPCIVRTYHFEPAQADSTSFLVMEYLPWPSGEKWIADAGMSGLPARSVAQMGARIAGALAYAHGQGLLHLDIKPSNIFVDPGGDNAKLGDFGLARVVSKTGSALQLSPAGTPAYMAPEQRLAGSSVTAATDVYQFGATLWDFLTGRPPKGDGAGIGHEGDGERVKVLQLLRGALAPVPSHRPTAAEIADRLSELERDWRI